ncbi:MAG: undecaprenyl-diphosphate phosphatase, partial [Limisphaerales bacterium]
GILFIGVEAWLRGRTAQEEITWRMAVMVGLGQLIAAVFPGASRSGTTILIALLMGLSRPRATEFSFLVGIPTMLAAGGYKIWKALKAPLNEGVAEDWAMVAWGAAVSGIVSFMAVKWLLGYVQSHSFRSFGVYRIAVGVLLLLIVFG